MEWLYRLAMAAGALLLFVAVARVAADATHAPRALIRAEALIVGSGFVAWLTVGTPPARWATVLELLLWIALCVPCLVLWILSSAPPAPPVTPTYPTRSRALRARYASRTRRA